MIESNFIRMCRIIIITNNIMTVAYYIKRISNYVLNKSQGAGTSS